MRAERVLSAQSPELEPESAHRRGDTSANLVWFDYNKRESNEYRDFSISQQASEATMFSAWVAQDHSALNLGG